MLTLTGAEQDNKNLSYTRCTLCPRECQVDRTKGERGVCGATDSLKLGRAALHWWEEPCLVGEQGSGAVFFSYCPMKCVYCQNYDLAHGAGFEISRDRLREIFLELQYEQHAANINLVTPTHYLPHIASVLEELRGAGSKRQQDRLSIPVVYNSSGFENPLALKQIKGLIDIYLVDFKYANKATARRLSHAETYPDAALASIEEMVNQVGEPVYDSETGLMKKGVIVRHLVLPGYIEDSFDALKQIHTRFGNSVSLSIMGQYTPLSSRDNLDRYFLDKPLTVEQYEMVLDYADSLGIEDYFWQEGGACEESFIPSFNGEGIVI